MESTPGEARLLGVAVAEQVATDCLAHAVSAGDVSLVLYDVTTLCFEADAEQALRNVGCPNYAEVVVMPRSWSRRRGSCWSATCGVVVNAA